MLVSKIQSSYKMNEGHTWAAKMLLSPTWQVKTESNSFGGLRILFWGGTRTGRDSFLSLGNINMSKKPCEVTQYCSIVYITI